MLQKNSRYYTRTNFAKLNLILISKLLLEDWSDWFQILRGVPDHEIVLDR